MCKITIIIRKSRYLYNGNSYPNYGFSFFMCITQLSQVMGVQEVKGVKGEVSLNSFNSMELSKCETKLLVYSLYKLGRNATYDSVLRHIFVHHSPSRNDGVVAYRDALQYRRVGTHPYVAPQGDGSRICVLS